MIVELTKKDFSMIKHMLNHDRINLEIKAVISGYNPGWVFVDSLEAPKTAMVWSKGIAGFYFVGQEDNTSFNSSINGFIDSKVSPRLKQEGLNSFEFSGTSSEWDRALDQIFMNRNTRKSKQFVYKSANDTPLNIYEKLERDYCIKKVDRSLLEDETYDVSFLRDAILEWWMSYEDYLKHGIGYGIFHKKVAICSCVTSFMNDEEMESHIVSKPEYRKKGLATAAVSAFLKEAKSKNYSIHWDCMERNLGSRALAEKHGLKKAFEYTLFEFELI